MSWSGLHMDISNIKPEVKTPSPQRKIQVTYFKFEVLFYVEILYKFIIYSLICSLLIYIYPHVCINIYFYVRKNTVNFVNQPY